MSAPKRMCVSSEFIESLLRESGNESSDICSEVDEDNFVESEK
jgi:hypothetical protein